MLVLGSVVSVSARTHVTLVGISVSPLRCTIRADPQDLHGAMKNEPPMGLPEESIPSQCVGPSVQ